MNLEALQNKLARKLSPSRFQHSLRVMEFACKLAYHYHVPVEPVAVAALLHDVAREIGSRDLLAAVRTYGIPILPVEQEAPVLIHGKVGAAILKSEWEIDDEGILEAVAFHVTGTPKPGLITELILIADFAEPARAFYAAEIARQLAFVHRQAALKYIFTQKIRYILDAGFLVHPLTIEARNQLILDDQGAN